MAAAGLFLFFLCLSIAFFGWSPYSRSLPLPRRWVLALLGVKLSCALAFGYILSHASSPSDTWEDFKGSVYYGRQIHNAADFIKYSFPDINSWRDLYHYQFWNDLKSNCFQVLLLGLNAVTLNNYYTDALIFSAFTFLGWLAFIRLWKTLYPDNMPFIYILPFLFPTFLLFYSGLHPDGLIFALLCVTGLDAYRLLTDKDVQIRTALRLLACFAGLILFKVFVALLLIPLLAAWTMVYRGGIRKVYAWLVLITGTLLLFITGSREIASRQQLYSKLASHISSSGSFLYPNLSSYARHLPVVLYHAFMPTLFAAYTNPFYWIAALEIMALWTLVALNGLKISWRSTPWSFFQSGWLYFIVVNWCLLGYTVPILGALIRYRALLLPFALALFIFPYVQGRISITKK